MSNKFTVLPAILAFVLLQIAGTLHAENSEITLYVGGFVGESFISRPAPLFPDVEAVFNDDFTAGFRYAYFFNSRIAGEVGAGFTPSSILTKGSVSGGTSVSSVVGVDTYILHANLIAHLAHGRVIPFVTGGVGAVHFGFETAQFGFLTPSETDFAWNAGGGVKIPIRENTALRFDGRAYWMNPDFALEETTRFEEISGGISILFDF